MTPVLPPFSNLAALAIPSPKPASQLGICAQAWNARLWLSPAPPSRLSPGASFPVPPCPHSSTLWTPWTALAWPVTGSPQLAPGCPLREDEATLASSVPPWA